MPRASGQKKKTLIQRMHSTPSRDDDKFNRSGGASDPQPLDENTMGITWRLELHYTCDGYDILGYNPDCTKELILDQVDSATKRGMVAVAKKAGWKWKTDEYCYCPSCAAKLASDVQHVAPGDAVEACLILPIASGRRA